MSHSLLPPFLLSFSRRDRQEVTMDKGEKVHRRLDLQGHTTSLQKGFKKTHPTALLLLQLRLRGGGLGTAQKGGGLFKQTPFYRNSSRLRLAITGQQANRTWGDVTRGRRSPAAWSADGSSTGGTDGSQSTSRSSLCLVPTALVGT